MSWKLFLRWGWTSQLFAGLAVAVFVLAFALWSVLLGEKMISEVHNSVKVATALSIPFLGAATMSYLVQFLSLPKIVDVMAAAVFSIVGLRLSVFYIAAMSKGAV